VGQVSLALGAREKGGDGKIVDSRETNDNLENVRALAVQRVDK
jgi:hypothetical protein